MFQSNVEPLFHKEIAAKISPVSCSNQSIWDEQNNLFGKVLFSFAYIVEKIYLRKSTENIYVLSPLVSLRLNSKRSDSFLSKLNLRLKFDFTVKLYSNIEIRSSIQRLFLVLNFCQYMLDRGYRNIIADDSFWTFRLNWKYD